MKPTKTNYIPTRLKRGFFTLGKSWKKLQGFIFLLSKTKMRQSWVFKKHFCFFPSAQKQSRISVEQKKLEDEQKENRRKYYEQLKGEFGNEWQRKTFMNNLWVLKMMNDYRIKKITKGNEVEFRAQRKFLWFWINITHYSTEDYNWAIFCIK